MRLDPRSVKAGYAAAIKALQTEIATMRAAYLKAIADLRRELDEARVEIAVMRKICDEWAGIDAMCERDHSETVTRIH